MTAFTDDPVRWVYLEPGRYLEWFPRLDEVVGRPTFAQDPAAFDAYLERIAADTKGAGV